MVGGENTGTPNLDGLSNASALDVIALLVDQAADEKNPPLITHALNLADQLESRGLLPAEAALLDYFRANAWACRYQQRYREKEALWDFEQPEIQQQVFLLRRAAHNSGFAMLEPVRQCQILTNLGNQLDTLGRFIEARACWTAALEVDPGFWMARANRGRGFMHYAAALYDTGHHCIFAYHAHRDLVEAVDLIPRFPHLGDAELRNVFGESAEQISRHFDLDSIGRSYKPDDWVLGETRAESAYRHWCLKHTLFLNPLNDLGPVSIAAHDVMSLPDFVLPLGEPPIVTGMFNELKQLFASARWLLWEGINPDEPHFSDRGVLLFNTLDYPSYGLSVEKVKAAFRLAYSIFDKIAYFLNFYFALEVPEYRVSFRTIWREKEGGPLREPVANSENWPLRGLYWLSKDLFEKTLKDTMEPEARALAELRNHLEHKYVKVHEMSVPVRREDDSLRDTLAYIIGRSDLEQKALRLLQLVRSALVYLSLAMHQQERRRARQSKGMTVPMPLDVWEDEWKR